MDDFSSKILQNLQVLLILLQMEVVIVSLFSQFLSLSKPPPRMQLSIMPGEERQLINL